MNIAPKTPIEIMLWKFKRMLKIFLEIILGDTGEAAACRRVPERLSEPVLGCTGPLTPAVPVVKT